jgi:hypothetical protein
MANTIIKGKIEDYNRSEGYDDEGIKIINYWIKVNGKKYTLTLPGKNNFYFESQLEVILDVNEDNVAVAGICPKKDYKWGKTRALKSEVKETDSFELAEGLVKEKRKETFNQSRGVTFNSSSTSTYKTIVTYTIVLPDKNFRVVEEIGKHIKPNTEIVAILENNVAYIIKDKTNNKIYGKPGKGYIISIFLWLAFLIAMFYVSATNQKDIFVSYNQVMIIGNLVFGIIFLISFTGFLSASKTYRIFNQMLNQS